MAAAVDSRPVPARQSRSLGTALRAAAMAASDSASSISGASPFEPSTTTPRIRVAIQRSTFDAIAVTST